MIESWTRRIDLAVFAVALVVLVLGAAGGPGWDSVDAVLAVELERSAAAPLYALVASVAAYVPIGEVGFRLAAANAVLGAVLLVGVARIARGLFPNDPVAGLVGVIVLLVARPFREAAAFAGPAMLASCGIVWAVAFALAHARTPSRSSALAALAFATIAIGSAPWLGALIAILVALWLWRTGAREAVKLATLPLGIVIVVLWIGAEGSLPELAFDAQAAIAATTPATIIVGAGLLGTGFAALTDLPHVRWLAVAIVLAAVYAVAIDLQPLPLLAVLAAGASIIPGAIVRVLGTHRRHVVAAVAGLPIAGGALLSNPMFSIDDPGHAPAQLATDVIGFQPPGPGLVFVRRLPNVYAITYAQRVAGARPDLELAAVLDDGRARAALGARLIVAAEQPGFGTHDPRLAFPRGRGFQLLPAPPPITAFAPLLPPARYASQVGREQATQLAIDRALYEAVNGRLGAAARAAGLTTRFGAADLAILSTTAPSRPAMYGFVPNLDELPPGPWMLELLGDDLAWSAGLPQPVVETPRARKLHALWRAVWMFDKAPDDPEITALGPLAVQATETMLAELAKKNRR